MDEQKSVISKELSKLSNVTTCQYLSNPSDIQSLSLKGICLKIIHLNIRSFYKHCDQLLLFLDELAKLQMEPDIILLCETFLTENSKIGAVINGYTSYHLCRENKTGGGVSIFVKDSINVLGISQFLCDDKMEILSLRIKTANTIILISEIYRIPNNDPKIFIESMRDILDNCVEDIVVIGTDQNIDLLNISNYRPAQCLLEDLTEKQCMLTITKPTRVTHTTATLIDNIYVKSKKYLVCNSAVICDDMSDHYPCYLILQLKELVEKSDKYVEKRNINKDIILKINHELLHKNWTPLYNIYDVNDAYHYLIECLNLCLDKFAPKKMIKCTNIMGFSEPWMTTQLCKFNRKCIRLCDLAKNTNNLEKLVKYRNYRVTLTRLKRSIKQTFYKKLFEKIGTNSKSLWSVLNSLMKKCKDKTVITSILCDGKLETDASKVVNIVNNHFATAGIKTQSKIPNIDVNAMTYMRRVVSNLDSVTTNEFELQMIVDKLKTKYSCGHDELSNALIKDIFVSIREPFNYIVNLSLSLSVFPTDMKVAKVNPLHKGGSTEDCDNLRPISLLPVLSKILEKVVFYRTIAHMERENIIYSRQFGFRKGHSTSDAIMTLAGEVLNSWNEGLKTLAIFIDLKKAFDTVSHNLVLDKLEYLGIRGSLLKWYCSYLTKRQQYTVVNDISSEKKELQVGVPQGSLLGVLLFQLLINDLKSSLKYSIAILYADDTTIMLSGRNLKFLKVKFQHDLDSLSVWLKANRLSLNANKTKVMYFSRGPHFENIDIEMNHQTIEQVNEFKFLGYIVDNKMACSGHFVKLHQQLLKIIFLIGRLKNHVPIGLLRNLYYAHFQSRLTYAISVWGGLMSKADLLTLHRLQKRLIRIIGNLSYREHCMPKFRSMAILTLTDEYNMSLCKLIHRIKLGLAPLPVKNLFTYNNSNSRNVNIILPKNKLKVVNSSFLVKAVMHWNQLNTELKQKETMKGFSKSYKVYCLSKY